MKRLRTLDVLIGALLAAIVALLLGQKMAAPADRDQPKPASSEPGTGAPWWRASLIERIA